MELGLQDGAIRLAPAITVSVAKVPEKSMLLYRIRTWSLALGQGYAANRVRLRIDINHVKIGEHDLHLVLVAFPLLSDVNHALSSVIYLHHEGMRARSDRSGLLGSYLHAA